MNTPTLDLAIDLLTRRSNTPEDAGCQELMISRLAPLGFKIERMRFDDVDNFYARRGTSGPLLVFAGHTDVVPTGPLEKWHTPPFEPTIKEGILYARGAADMKTSLAAFVTCIEEFVAEHPNHLGSIGLLITSDEEAAAINGIGPVGDASRTPVGRVAPLGIGGALNVSAGSLRLEQGGGDERQGQRQQVGWQGAHVD